MPVRCSFMTSSLHWSKPGSHLSHFLGPREYCHHRILQIYQTIGLIHSLPELRPLNYHDGVLWGRPIYYFLAFYQVKLEFCCTLTLATFGSDRVQSPVLLATLEDRTLGSSEPYINLSIQVTYSIYMYVSLPWKRNSMIVASKTLAFFSLLRKLSLCYPSLLRGFIYTGKLSQLTLIGHLPITDTYFN